jgi:Flp pilus assembly protein TadD
MANLYRDQIGAPNLEDVEYVDDLGLDESTLRARLVDADVVIVQERDFKRDIVIDGRGALVFRFPMIVAGFLWPFANEPHVHNVAERPISDGPYPSQMSDSFLNRLIVRNVSPEDALEQYLALDIAKVAHLDRLMEIYLDKQRQRDLATGYAIATEIENRFRTERLFLTAEHPDGFLFGIMARQLFDRMSIPETVVTQAVSGLSRSPFPPTELPVHPGVVSHFGLTFISPDARYRYLDEGFFTFEEYVLRYMRYENNPELRTGIYMAGREDPALTLQRLEVGLAQSPRSERGLAVKGLLLDRLGRNGEALEALQAAASMERVLPGTRIEYARMLLCAGHHGQAEAVSREVLADDPHFGPAHLIIAEVNIALGDLDSAAASAHEALRSMPGEAGTYRTLAIALMQKGQHADAEALARRAMTLQPDVPDHCNLVAELLEHQARREEALMLLHDYVAAGRQNDQTYSLLGHFLLRNGALAEAEQAFAEGSTLYGEHRPDLIDGLHDVRRLRQGATA